MKSEKQRLARNSQILAPILWASDCLDFGNFTLTSGKTSPYYVDLRLLPSYPILFDRAVQLAVDTLHESGVKFERICAVPTGGLPIGTLIANKTETPLIYVRKTGKEHGERQQIEGKLAPGDRVLVVDDLITTGGSILSAIQALRLSDVEVTDCLVLLDRTEGGKKNLREQGVELHKVSNIKPVVEELSALNQISPTMRDKVFKYLQKR